MLRVRDHDVHRRPEGGSSIRGDCHEPPVTVLADDELPELAEPGDSDGDELLDVGEGVVVLVPMVVVVDAADPADDVPACVRAAANRAGRFTVGDPELAVAVAAGTLMGLGQLLHDRPDRDDEAATDQVTEDLLCRFGLPAGEAHDICTRPLPALG